MIKFHVLTEAHYQTCATTLNNGSILTRLLISKSEDRLSREPQFPNNNKSHKSQPVQSRLAPPQPMRSVVVVPWPKFYFYQARILFSSDRRFAARSTVRTIISSAPHSDIQHLNSPLDGILIPEAHFAKILCDVAHSKILLCSTSHKIFAKWASERPEGFRSGHVARK